MILKNIFNTIFTYTPPEHYQFSLPDNDIEINKTTNIEEKKINIYPSLKVNLEFMKNKYNALINSDIVLREFTINARGKQYDAFIVYIDGMVDTQILDDFILKPLMLRNKSNTFDGSQNKIISEVVANNITVRKVKKFNLSDYLMGCLIPQNSITEAKDFDAISSRNKLWRLCSVCRNFTYSI